MESNNYAGFLGAQPNQGQPSQQQGSTGAPQYQQVQLIPSQFPLPPMVVLQHLSQNPPDPRLWDQTKSNDFRGVVRDYNDAVALQHEYFNQRHNNHDYPPIPSHDPSQDFPQNDPARQKALVGQIFKAIRNKNGLLNGQAVRDDHGQAIFDASGKILRKPDANTKRIDELPDVKLELLCWSILIGIRDAHEGSLYATEWSWAYSFNYEPYETFMKRFEKVLELLEVSKRAVCDLLEASWMCRIANAPDWELERKRRNKDGNAKKGNYYKEGKKKMQSKRSSGGAENAGQGDGDLSGVADEEPREARPRKRQRRAPKTSAAPAQQPSTRVANFGDQQVPALGQPRVINPGLPQLSNQAFAAAPPPMGLPPRVQLPPAPFGGINPVTTQGSLSFGGAPTHEAPTTSPPQQRSAASDSESDEDSLAQDWSTLYFPN
ncbi:hypothetical protein VP1G_01940 [Cytospora mali]|uniref:Uncharacterized protein n=1 Tax=Cytospora mali TaxID=578113 RepID=A0A194USB5_CYTMA|nr:hypothetical protein VP1G_01940 [Valsa mali var. pyri (nom. inval.)]